MTTNPKPIKTKLVKAKLCPCYVGLEPAWVLPGDAKGYSAMVEQMAKGMHRGVNGRPHTIAWRYLDADDAFRIAYTNGARNALAAIGIKEPRK